MRKTKIRVLTILSVGGLVLSFVLSWILRDPSPFTVVGGIAVGGKALDNAAEKKYWKGESE